MNVLEIPGYAEAVLKEQVVRDAAFLDITESIGPFEVVPMTLRHYLLLRTIRHPLVYKDTPGPEELTYFLWILSPKFTSHDGPERRAHIKDCKGLFYLPNYLPLLNTARARARHQRRCDARLAVAAKLITKCRGYFDETMQDRPPSPSSSGFDAEYITDAAYFCGVFGREYGWSQDETLGTPLKRVFQYVNEIKLAKGSSTPLFNPSDRVKSDWMRSLAAARGRN